MPSPDSSSQNEHPQGDGGSKIIDRALPLSTRAAAIFLPFQFNGRIKAGRSFSQAYKDVRKHSFKPAKISTFATGEVAAKMPVGTADFLEDRFVLFGMQRKHAKLISSMTAAVATSLLEGIAAFSLVDKKDGIKAKRVLLPSVATWALARDTCGAFVLAKALKKDEGKKSPAERIAQTSAAAAFASAISTPLDVMHTRKGMSAARVSLPELGRLSLRLIIPRMSQSTLGAAVFVATQLGLEHLRKPRNEPPAQATPPNGDAGAPKRTDQISRKPSSRNVALNQPFTPPTLAFAVTRFNTDLKRSAISQNVAYNRPYHINAHGGR